MSLNTIATDDAEFLLEELGESVLVDGLAGGLRTVTAAVERGAAARETGQAHTTRAWECRVTFRDDDTTGSDATGVGYRELRQLEAGGRRWAIRLAEDGAAERWDFQEVESAGGGLVTCRFSRTALVRTGRLRPSEL